MDFQILGPLQVRSEQRTVKLGGPQPRAALAVLLLHANEPVSAGRLALALWGEEAPPKAIKRVHVLISRLRRDLGDPDVITTTPIGYCLRVRPDELDSERFERLADEGRRALADGQPEHAARLLRQALALWRGPPLADLAFEPFAAAEIQRLEEQRLNALEARIEADLAAGRHAETIAELQQLVAEHPGRERLAGQLMLALYRCGRQAEALKVYRDARTALVEQLGLEPGPDLRRLHDAILRQDVSLESESAAELPPELDSSTEPPLIGRRDELSWLRLHWNRSREGAGAVIALAGISGSGKRRLAAELAAIVHDSGDSVLYAAASGPADALLTALRRAAQPARPTLLVIDDADDADGSALTELQALSRTSEDLPVLVLACCEDADALEGVRKDGTLNLEPLNAAAVGAIAQQYARGIPAEDVPVDWLLQASGGIPRAVHEVAGQWARHEAARHVGAVAGRAATEREQLRVIQAELTGGVEELQEVRERITPRTWNAPVVCPFKGLASFNFADAEYFCGREKLIAELVARLVGAQLLGIVGPSGSGKSSLLQAGLLPALANGVLPGSDTWRHLLIRPGAHPLRELTDAMDQVGDKPPYVIAVDQFEETFTICEDEAERAAFIAELSRIAGTRDGTRVVAIALRADFYGRCAAYPELAGPLAANHVLVRSMQRNELRRAIELPARQAGLRVDPELVDALVLDVNDEPGALPLLSTALLELWQHRDGRRLRHSVYEETGGVRGAVARLAEDAFAALNADEQAIARGVLMGLVGEAVTGGVERRRIALEELETEGREDVARVVALLTERRLLTVSARTIELAHEALMREWPRLREWIEADRDGLRIHRNLTAAAAEWEELGRDDGALYRGARLAEAREWNAAHQPRLNETEGAFLAASEAARARERATRRRRTGLVLSALTIALVVAIGAAIYSSGQRDTAESRELATKSSALLSTDPGLALALALEALRRSDTEQARNAVRQATLEHRATRVIRAHGGLVFGLALSPDGRLAATAGDDRTVRIWRLETGRRVGEIRGHRDEVMAVAFSPDGKRIASADRAGEIALGGSAGGPRKLVARLDGGDFARSIGFVGIGMLAIGTDSSREEPNVGRVALVRLSNGALRDLSAVRTDAVFALDVGSGGRKVVAAGRAGVARIWDVAGGQPLELPHDGAVVATSFSPDGKRVATGGVTGELRLWDADSGRAAMRSIQVSDQPLTSVRFSADGSRIAVADFKGVIRSLSSRGRGELAELKGHRGPTRLDFAANELVSAGEDDSRLRTWSVPAARIPEHPGRVPRFSRDGTLIVSGAENGPIHVWNTKTGEERELTGHSDVSYPQFSPDGKRIVSASHDGSVRLWEVATGRSRDVPVPPDSAALFGAAIDTTGRRIAICGATPRGGGLVVIQASDGSDRLLLRGHRGRVNALVFDPESEHLLTGSDDGTARVWNPRTGELERTLRGHDGPVRSASYSDDGKRMATAGSDGTVRVWSASGGDPVILLGHEGPINTAQFNGRGDRLVTAGDDGTIRIWDTAGGAALVVLYRHDGIASGADFGSGDSDVVSAGEDGMRAMQCDVCGSFEQVLRTARTRAQHKLTAAQRRLLLSGS